MTDYAAVLSSIRPGTQWSLDGNTYDGLTWLDETPKPSQAELDAAWPQVQYDRAYTRVELDRHAAYTAPGGPDSIFLRWQRGDATEQEWLDAVQAVKDAHPYPEPVLMERLNSVCSLFGISWRSCAV
jgi:hypothetical protein